MLHRGIRGILPRSETAFVALKALLEMHKNIFLENPPFARLTEAHG